jgi:hypothetical protein
MKNELTILIPTFNRPERLNRLLLYLNLCLLSKKIPIHSIRFLIIDGTGAPNKIVSEGVIKLENSGLNIELMNQPGVGLAERYAIAANEIKTNYVLVCGDDDLPDFDGITYWLNNRSTTSESQVFAGRFTNIYGISILRLVVKHGERPFSGLKIKNPDPLVRIAQYSLANSFGVTSLSYSIQPSELFRDFWSARYDKTYFFGGIELMHQIFLAGRAKIELSEHNLIFRDFSYIGYEIDSGREASAENVYPYYGESAIKKCCDFIVSFCGLTDSEAKKFVEEIIESNKALENSRQVVQSALEAMSSCKSARRLCATPPEVRLAWRRSYFSCYPKIAGLRRIIILSLPSKIIDYLKRLIEKPNSHQGII